MAEGFLVIVLLLDQRLEVNHGVEFLWGIAKQGLQIADEPVHVPLARGLVDYILVVVVAQAPAQLFVVHLRLVLPHTPPSSHLSTLHHVTLYNNVNRKFTMNKQQINLGLFTIV